MTILAALLMVVGTGCHLVHPTGVCTNGVWITSILAATLAVLATEDQCKLLYRAAICSTAVMVLFIMLGTLKLLQEIKEWPED